MEYTQFELTMPIYEFYCPQNNTVYSFLAKRLISSGEIPRCPGGEGLHMERVMSGFSITGAQKKSREGEDGEAGGGMDFDDPRMEAAMAELERDMAGMDEENPDPRQLGRLMRKMSDLTGERLDGEMEEMVRKLEEGADPDALEEEFGDFTGDEDCGDGMCGMDEDGPDGAAGKGGAGDSATSSARKVLRRALARRKDPRKDPNLYDWDEYAAVSGQSIVSKS